jgi:TolB-like protein/Tfp pilus assembly protein PilF
MVGRNFFAELKRRNVYKVGAAYVVVAWLLIQVATQTFPFFEIPNWAVRLVVVILALGFPVALVFAWAYELTPEGLKRTEDVPPGHSVTHSTGRKLDFAIIGVLALAVALLLFDRFRPKSQLSEAAQAAKSIAVLPLVNQSGDPGQEYFSDGLSEELINGLGQLRDVRVIGRNSSFHFKGKSADSRAVGKALGVANLLEGSVRKAGDRVRITVQLVDTATGTQRWSQTYDRELKDIFAVQSEIAKSIADELRLTLLAGELKPSARPSNGNLDAYQAFLQGEHHGRRGTIDSLTKAIGFLDEAIQHDPKYAEAYALKSLVRSQIGYFYGAKGRDYFEQARAAAEAALVINPDLERAHSALAYVHINDWDLGAAEERLRSTGMQAQTSLNMLALIRSCQGRFDEAVQLERRALELDPFFALFHRNLGAFLTAAGRFDEAERAVRRATELQPLAPEYHLALVELALLRGQVDVAMREAELEPAGLLRDAAVTLVHAARGDREAADATLRSFIEAHGESAPFRIASIYAFRRDADNAFAWLDRAYIARDPRLIRLYPMPFVSNLKSDGRFAELCRKLNLPQPP